MFSRKSLSAAVAAALTCSALASAQSEMSEVVVTAARSSSPLRVVTDPRLPRQPVPAHDGADYLKTIPGFSVIRKGGTDGDAVFRGMAASRVGMVADGGVIHGGCSSRMDPPTAYIFPQSYDRITVLKGPQSVLWGPGASAATVLFERDPWNAAEASHSLYASAMSGSWGRRDLAIDGTLGGKLGYLRLQGSDSRSDDYASGSGDRVHSQYHRWNSHVAVGFTPRPGSLIELSAAASDGEAAYADRMMDGVFFERRHMGLRVEQTLDWGIVQRLDARLSWNGVDHAMDNFSLRSFTPSAMMPEPTVSNPDRRTLNGRMQLTLVPAAGMTLEAGIDSEDNRHRDRMSRNQTRMPYQDLPRVADAEFRQLGLFAEWQYELTGGQRFAAGARIDRWRIGDLRETLAGGMMGHAMSRPNPTAGETARETLPSAFARYERELIDNTGKTTLFAGLGHAQRTADYWERIAGARASDQAPTALYLDPEKTTQWDMGLIRETSRSRVAASLFANQIDDYILIDTRFPGREGMALARSVRARSAGGELEFGYRLGESWLAELSMAYTHGRNVSDGGALAQMPPLETRASLNWQRGNWSAGTLLRGVAAQRRVDPGRGNIVGQDIGNSSGFLIASLNAAWQASEAVQISLGIDNLFDRDYAEHLARSGAMVPGFVRSDQVSEPGRMLWARLSYAL